MRSETVRVRVTKKERLEWKSKADTAGISLSKLIRESVGRVRTWTASHAEIRRKINCEIAKIGNNLNQVARWCNTHKEEAKVFEVVAHLCAIEREIKMLDHSVQSQKQDGNAY